MNSIALLLPLTLAVYSCTHNNAREANHRQEALQQARDTCDDPDASIHCCFVKMPANLTGKMTIAGPSAAGERMVIRGRVLHADGKTPYPGVLLYGYHTDATGHYTKQGGATGFQKWHGALHGWCRTGADGRYEIASIRPARYPDNSMPAHIHVAVKLPDGSEPFYINDLVFKDDDLVNDRYLASLRNPGGTGVVDLTRTAGGVWTGQRDIVLGR